MANLDLTRFKRDISDLPGARSEHDLSPDISTLVSLACKNNKQYNLAILYSTTPHDLCPLLKPAFSDSFLAHLYRYKADDGTIDDFVKVMSDYKGKFNSLQL